MIQHPKCLEWQQRGERVLAGGPATLSKMPSRYPFPLAPSVLVSGDGAYVTCPDGIRYLDPVAALGPVILGHNNAAVTLAVMEQADRLACSTLSTPLECEVAEMLCALVPGAEHVRFASNGKDVTEAAVKLARHVTGHGHVIYCGYAGGFADYLSTTDKHGGTLKDLTYWNHQVPWRDFDALEETLNKGLGHIRRALAAIILEVPPEAQHVTRAETTEVLHRYQNIAHDYGGLFIIDEVVTGLRYALGGAQEYYGVRADLVTMSKALGNGAPISALVGPRDLMQAFDGGTVFLSTTFGASPIGLAAAKATLTELQSSHGLASLQHHGEALRRTFQAALTNDASPMPITMRGNHARLVFDFHEVPGIATAAEIRTYWLQEFAKEKVLAGVPWFPMCSWTEEMVPHIGDVAAGTCDALYAVITHGTPMRELLEVPVIDEVFQRYVPSQGTAQ